MPIDFLTGDRSLRRMRDQAHDHAREMYDPSVFDPSIGVARRRAAEGIDTERRGEDILGQMFREAPDADIARTAGTAGRALAATAQMDDQRQRTIADIYADLESADEEVRMEAEQQLGQLQTQARQVQQQQEAAIHEADMMYEAQRDARRQALLGTAIGGAGMLVSSGVGGVIGDFFTDDDYVRPGGLEEFDDVIAEPEYDFGHFGPATGLEYFEDDLYDAPLSELDLRVPGDDPFEITDLGLAYDDYDVSPPETQYYDPERRTARGVPGTPLDPQRQYEGFRGVRDATRRGFSRFFDWLQEDPDY